MIIPASLWIDTGYNAHPLEHGIGLHVLLSILAYAVLVLSACQALLLMVQDRQLKDGHIRGVMRLFPPMQVMESMLFDTIWLGQSLLTLAILFGFMYVDDLFAQHLVHKTVLTLVSWVIFAVLLGRPPSARLAGPHGGALHPGGLRGAWWWRSSALSWCWK